MLYLAEIENTKNLMCIKDFIVIVISNPFTPSGGCGSNDFFFHWSFCVIFRGVPYPSLVWTSRHHQKDQCQLNLTSIYRTLTAMPVLCEMEETAMNMVSGFDYAAVGPYGLTIGLNIIQKMPYLSIMLQLTV